MTTLILSKYQLSFRVNKLVFLCYNKGVEPIHKHASSVFISRPLRAAQYQEIAIRYGMVQQLSRPF